MVLMHSTKISFKPKQFPVTSAARKLADQVHPHCLRIVWLSKVSWCGSASRQYDTSEDILCEEQNQVIPGRIHKHERASLTGGHWSRLPFIAQSPFLITAINQVRRAAGHMSCKLHHSQWFTSSDTLVHDLMSKCVRHNPNLLCLLF